MFRQKQTPQDNNPPKKMLRKYEAKTTAEHPYRRVITTELHMQLYWNHTPAPALHRKSAAHSQNTPSEEHLRRAASVLIFNLEVKFCQKKLIKIKKLMRPLISYDYLKTVIVENVCIHKLTKFPCKWKKRISLYSL